MSKELNIIYSDKYLDYDLGDDNPISKNKTQRFLKLIEGESWIKYNVITPDPIEEEDLLFVHTPEYLQRLNRLALNSLSYDQDTPVNTGMITGGLYIIGGTLSCLDMAAEGKLAVNLIGGMHHAGIAKASGFCIYNDHAIAIRKLQKDGKINNAVVIDLDVHAGQGTQEIFYDDPSVLTISIHQDPRTIYPGVGFESQRGKRDGIGKNVNICLPPNTTETTYMHSVENALQISNNFERDLTVLLLGVDTWKHDMLGQLSLTKESFIRIGERFRNVPNLGILFAGGYSNSIPELWLNFLKGYLN